MTNITLDGLPAKTGTISDAGIIHYREGGVDKKMTVADFLTRISEEYSTDINSFLGAADKAAARAALAIARRTTVNNAAYTILATDKVVAQIGTMSAARIFTLPAAVDYPAGEELIIVDESGTVTNTNKITVSRVSTDTIDGSSSIDILEAYGSLRLISNGTNAWKISNNLLATFSEVIAAANKLKFLSPASLANLYTASTLASGLFSIPIINSSGNTFDKMRIYAKSQTTTIPAGGGATVITFGSAFPNACLAVVITPKNWSGSNPGIVSPFVTGVSTSNFTCSNPDGDTNITEFFYIAIGY